MSSKIKNLMVGSNDSLADALQSYIDACIKLNYFPKIVININEAGQYIDEKYCIVGEYHEEIQYNSFDEFLINNFNEQDLSIYSPRFKDQIHSVIDKYLDSRYKSDVLT